MKVGIASIGTAVPPYQYTQREVIDFLIENLSLSSLQQKKLSVIYRGTGIDKRYSVINDHLKKFGNYSFFPNKTEGAFPSTKDRMEMYKNNAPALAINAIEDCLNANASNYSEILTNITHIITVSCTGMYAPGLDIDIIRHYQLSPTINRTAINFMGCYGAFNAIKTAYAICKSDPKASVLIVCLELCSIHFQKPDAMDKLISSAIFGDGAAAIIIKSYNSNNVNYLTLEDFYCSFLPQTEEMMAWSIADNGFDIVLSSYVPMLIENGIKNFFETFLKLKCMDFSNIQHYAIHPGGKKILQACENALKITTDQNYHAYEILREFGNMSSATILFLLKRIWENLHTKNESVQNILCCAFGPGLTLESMLISYQNG